MCAYMETKYRRDKNQNKLYTEIHILNINNEIYKSNIKLLLRMCVVFDSSFDCISACANVFFKSILQECLRAGLPSGFPSTAPPPVRVSAVLGTLPVSIPNHNFFFKKPFRQHQVTHAVFWTRSLMKYSRRNHFVSRKIQKTKFEIRVRVGYTHIP